MRGTTIAFIGQFFLPLLWTMVIVAGVSILHEIITYQLYGWDDYGSFADWQKNTIGDLVFEIGIGVLVAI